MPTAIVSHEFNVPPARVFSAISEIERFPEINEDVLRVVFLTDSRTGVGTRFRETRRMGSREQVFELEVAEYDAEAMRFRAVCEADGVTWDTLMTVDPLSAGKRARLTLAMDAIGHSWPKRLLTRLFVPMFRRGMRKHMRAMANYFEATAMAQSRS